jgi:hypothetical protein
MSRSLSPARTAYLAQKGEGLNNLPAESRPGTPVKVAETQALPGFARVMPPVTNRNKARARKAVFAEIASQGSPSRSTRCDRLSHTREWVSQGASTLSTGITGPFSRSGEGGAKRRMWARDGAGLGATRRARALETAGRVNPHPVLRTTFSLREKAALYPETETVQVDSLITRAGWGSPRGSCPRA